jgi:pyrroline-5-carboxylate reductase
MADGVDTVAVLGAGAMGEAVLAGLIAAGRPGSSVLVAERRLERGHELAARYGVTVLENLDAAAQADLVLVAVKPQDVASLLDEVGDSLRPGAVVVSIAAGLSTTTLEASLPAGTAVVRVMPNTPALVGEGMSVLSAGSACTPEQLARAHALMAAVGQVAEVAEPYQDAVTAVSGSGPAYVFAVAEALVDAGVKVGLPRPLATELTVQTLYGAAAMLRRTGTHPTLLREQVTSPGGTTAAALAVLDERAVKAAFRAAVEAARDRSAELG